MRKLIVLLMALVPMSLWAQFAPGQNYPGTTAMHADSSAFVAWATGYEIVRGPMNITDPGAGMASFGQQDESVVLGAPGGTMDVVSLVDGGMATLTFRSPICNRQGPDFAVFENGLTNAGNQDLYFLEIGFVEVSSDGVNFFRFPAVTNVQTETQLDGFTCMDPAQIHNFAGKYGVMYGTPFDLDEVPDDPLLDKNNITHVRIIDVVGNIDPEFATYDSQGHPVNDPWPTPFASSGFDLDAVGVIHDLAHNPGFGVDENDTEILAVYPNPAHDKLFVNGYNVQTVGIFNVIGHNVLMTNETEIDVRGFEPGIYFVRINCGDSIITERVIIK